MNVQKGFGGLITNKDPQTDDVIFSKTYIRPSELKDDWKKCGQIAQKLAEEHAKKYKNKENAISILSTVINELLENAVKYSSHKNKLISVSINSDGSTLSIISENITDERNAKALTDFVEELKTENLEALYLKHLTKAMNSTGDESGLGIIGIIRDYNIDAGITISRVTQSVPIYDVYVTLSLEEATVEAA